MALGGFKDFTAEIATSGDVDAYLMQGVLVFASTTARNTALSSYLEEGRFAYTLDDNSTWYYNGSAWVALSTPWVDYTPTWSNLTVGNATVVAKARYIGGDLRLRGFITWGTTTSASGVIYQNLPYSATVDSAGASGSGALNDTGNRIYPLITDVAASDTQLSWFHPETGGTLTDGSPVTLGTGDLIRWDITVPLA